MLFKEENGAKLPNYYQWLSVPITDHPPCGIPIDYHPDYLAIQQQLTPTLAAEYGDFTAPYLPVRWETIEPIVRGLTHICKDIRLIILLIRCRIPVIGIDALSEGIQAIIYLLHQWPEQLYPQCQDEGEYVPEYRQNALMWLDDDEGIIADIRQLTLQVSEIERLTISEIEQRISRDSSSIHTLEKMLHANKHFLEQCWQAQSALEQLCCLPDAILGCGSLSCLKLEQLLALFSQHPLRNFSTSDLTPQVAEHSPTPECHSSYPVPAVDHLSYRTIAFEQLRQMQSWFAFYEPSSPIQLILHFAEKSIGKDFHQIQQMYPSELIALLKTNED